jgi:hypothetical protein
MNRNEPHQEIVRTQTSDNSKMVYLYEKLDGAVELVWSTVINLAALELTDMCSVYEKVESIQSQTT